MNSKLANCLAGAALVVTVGAMPSPTHAQTDITVYGRLDAGLEYVDRVQDATGAVHSMKRTADNQWGTSMLGFKGSERLGDGLSTYFLLESGFSSTKGVPNSPAFFSRRAYFGLASERWGKLQLGKNLFNSNDTYYFDPTGHQYISSATLVRGRSWAITDNLVAYTTPNLGGLSVDFNVGLGELAGSSQRFRSEGVSAAYARGDLELRAIYTQRRDGQGRFSDVYNFSKEAVVGGSYRLGAAKLFAAVERISAPSASAASPDQLKHGWIGVRYDVTPAFTLIGAGYRVIANKANGSATLVVVGADYHLSKRTFLYATLGGVQNSAAANFSAEITVDGPGAGRSQRAVYSGMGHSF